jgi:hypothetical protein
MELDAFLSKRIQSSGPRRKPGLAVNFADAGRMARAGGFNSSLAPPAFHRIGDLDG